MVDELSELQRDALMETFNIGVGRASRGLSQLLGCDVALSVPIIVQMPSSDVRQMLDPSLPVNDVCLVSRRIGGEDAEVVMLFQGQREGFAALMPSTREVDEPGRDIRADVVTKFGYLVIESCVDQVEQVIARKLERHPVKYVDGLPERVFEVHKDQEQLLVVKIDMMLKKHGIGAHMLFSFSEQAANRLAEGLDRIIAESAEDGPAE